jgi:hypothetical protein
MFRRIETADDYFTALARIEDLRLTEDLESDAELELLANLVEDYEERHPEVVFDIESRPQRLFA